MSQRRALITGAAGFLGGHLLSHMAGLGWQATGTGLAATLPNMLACDLTNATAVAGLVQQTAPEVIFHTAALTPASAPKASYSDYMTVNVNGTVNLLEAVRQHVPDARVILVTSSAMYGLPSAADGIIHEDSPLRPVNAYGVSKASQHLVGYQFTAQHQLDVVRVCPFNLIGYGLPKGLAAADFAAQIVAVERGKQPPIIRVGDLSGQRDFLDVADAVSALIALVEAGQSGEAYNLASAEAVSMHSLLTTLLAMSEQSIRVEPRTALIPNTVPVQIGLHDKLTAATAWQPRVALAQSLADVLAYWRSTAS